MYYLRDQFAVIEKADLLYQAGRHQQALETLNELDDELIPVNLSNYCIIYASCCVHLNEFNKAFDFTLTKLNEYPNNPNLYYLMSWVCSKMNKPEEGLQYILKAIELDPQKGNYHSMAACIYLDLGNIAQSDYHLSFAEEQYPEDEHTIYFRTVIHQ